jgi:choice-of-anchor B domain-containing protein
LLSSNDKAPQAIIPAKLSLWGNGRVHVFIIITLIEGYFLSMRKFYQSIFILAVLFPSFAFSQANGVTLLGSLNQPHGSTNCYGTMSFSSCWGWVSPDGREYALLGTYTGTAIIDLNVSPIQELQHIPGPPASCAYREIKTYKHYAYIVSEGGQGVQIVDLSALPDTAILVRNFNYTNGGRNILRSHTVTLADGYLYLNGSAGWSPGGVVIFSLHNDPTNPEYVGQFQPQYIHDSFVRNDTLYAAAIYSGGGVYVVNIQNKANPQILRFIQYSGSGTHHAWSSINGGRYVFTTDEIGTVNNVKIWDLQNLGSGPPYTPLAQYRASPNDIVHNVHGRGNYLYVSHYSAGMRVVDVHNPAAPVEVGWYDSYPGASGSFNGCWGVYPYFPSGRWIGSDMQTGLYLLNFSGLAPRTRSPLLTPVNNDSAGQSGSIPFRWRAATNQAEDPHYYMIHLYGSGLDTLLRSNDTSLTLANLPALQQGQTYTWHVWIKDEFTEVSSQDTFRFVFNGSAVEVSDEGFTPKSYRLHQNYPNPFNPTTSIRFAVPASGQVEIKVYTLLGEVVATLVNGIVQAGEHHVSFDASRLPSGMYLYKMKTAAGVTEAKKMIVLK